MNKNEKFFNIGIEKNFFIIVKRLKGIWYFL